MLAELLTDYNFSPREAKIYLTSLEFGEDVVSSIARRAGENRVTTYSILKDLTKKGIANEIVKNKKKYYSVISPQKLVKQQEDKYKKLKESLPELLAVQSEYAHKPKIYFYEGFDGVKEVYKDTLQYQNHEILTFRGMEQADKRIEEYILTEYQDKRIKQKIDTRIIYSKEDLKFKETQYKYTKENRRQILVLDDPIFSIASEINIYWESKIALIMTSKEEMSGIIIESKKMNESLRNIFNLLRKTHAPQKPTSKK